MYGKGVAGEHDVDVAAAYQFLKMGAAAGVHNHRSSHDGDAPTRGFDFLHHRRDAGNADFDAPFRRDFVRHECEAMTIAFLELGNDANAVHAAHDGIALPHVAQLAAIGVTVLDDDHRVHALAIDVHPLPFHPDHRSMVRRRIE